MVGLGLVSIVDDQRVVSLLGNATRELVSWEAPNEPLYILRLFPVCPGLAALLLV